MALTQRTKNGVPEALATKVPWTDEQGIAMKIYEGVTVALDVLMLFIRMSITWVHSIYQLIVPPEQRDVSGDVVLITGTGHGMGREMALRFARLGAVLVCVDIDSKGNQQTVDMIKQENGKAHRYECDVTNRTAVAEMASRVRKEVGDITILVNNAGLMPCKPLLQHNEREVRNMFDVNVLAHIWLLQEFLPAMLERNHGHIVGMSSMAGMLGLRNLVPYCASKFAVRGLLEALHEELREDPRDFSGIRVTGVCPYIVDTGLCKNPKIKYPSLMRIVSAGEAADCIVDAVRRGYTEITIPGSLYYVNKVCRAMPNRVPLHLKDFLDSGLEPHSED